VAPAGVVRFTKTKTNRTREVAIVGALATILDALAAGAPGDFVFPVPRRQSRRADLKRTEEQRRRDVASKAWSSFAAAHDLHDLHAHDLRHHAATMIRRAGGGLDTVAKVLGHTNVRTAARYAHVEVEDTRRFLEAASKPQRVAFPMPTTPKAGKARAHKKQGGKRNRRQ
jgi:integrase